MEKSLSDTYTNSCKAGKPNKQCLSQMIDWFQGLILIYRLLSNISIFLLTLQCTEASGQSLLY